MGFLSWLFGKKKKEPEKKPGKKETKADLPVPPKPSDTKPQQQQKLPNKKTEVTKTTPYHDKPTQFQSKQQQKELINRNKDQWVYDAMLEFLHCPSWVNPIEIFINENCILFDEGDENHHTYDQIFTKFQGMIDILLDGFITELNISEQQFQEQFFIGLQIQPDRKYFEQLIVAQDFIKFKKQMIRRNKDLEIEAFRQFEEEEKRNNQNNPNQLEQNRRNRERLELEKYDMELEHAIAMSKAMNDQLKNRQQQEDEEFQKAISLSQLEYERTQDKIKEEERLLKQKLMESQNDELQRIEKEEKARKEQEEKQKIEDEKRKLEESKKELELEKQKQEKEHNEKLIKQKEDLKKIQEEAKTAEEEKQKNILIEQEKQRVILEQQKAKKQEEDKKKAQEQEQQAKKQLEIKMQEESKQQQELREQQQAALAQANAQQQQNPVIDSKVIDTGLLVDLQKKQSNLSQQNAQKLETQTVQIEEQKKTTPQFKGIQPLPVLGKEAVGMATNPKKSTNLEDLMRERLALQEKLQKIKQEDEDQSKISEEKKMQENIAERKKRLQAQRELILKKKNQDLQKEQDNFNLKQGRPAANPTSLKLQNFFDQDKKDKDQEKEKQLELYSKIQSNLNQE